ncbi:MAG TPA: hypothetical protein DCP97_02950 [Ruminococcaceae bacterium]|nr:hypothetical protein [Oscillospiraceae bacterium]
MKRLIITCCIFLLLIVISSFFLLNLRQTTNSLLLKIDEINRCLDENNTELAAQKSEELFNEWKRVEPVMLRYVRHSSLDSLSAAIARINAFAQFGEIGELRAELAEASVQIRHIWNSEKPTLFNML